MRESRYPAGPKGLQREATQFLRIGRHVEVVNQRVGDDGEQFRLHRRVRRVVEVRSQPIHVIEFEDRCVRQIDLRQLFVGATYAEPPPNVCTPDRRNPPQRACPNIDELPSIGDRHVRPQSK